ncbi:hypothetical protein DFH29DRAFT_994090 [Suillus ampliporus]|nr:hypothetical protein DFH29DRAFT_994090 [Suillus ampliporus]
MSQPTGWELPGPTSNHGSNFLLHYNNPSGHTLAASPSDISDSLKLSPISPASPLDDNPQWDSNRLPVVPHEHELYSSDHMSSRSSRSLFDSSSSEFSSSNNSNISHVVSRLQAQKSALLQKYRSLEVMVAKLEGKLEEADKRYAELLERIQLLYSVHMTSGDPFLAVANAAEKADVYPTLEHNDYPGIIYWHKSEYHSDYHGGRGVIRMQSTAESGALKFITDKDGIVVSEARQREMRDKFRTLCFTLLKYGCAPVSWMKIDAIAAKFFHHSMWTAFPELCLCSNGWKATSLAVEYYSQWKYRPHKAITIMKTETASSLAKPLTVGIKREPSSSSRNSQSNSRSSSTSKRPLSLTLATSAPPHTKKTKVHTSTVTADADSAPVIHEPPTMSISMHDGPNKGHENRRKQIFDQIVSPTLHLYQKNHTDPPSSLAAPAAVTTTAVDDSELTLTALLEKASFDDSPQADASDLDQNSKFSFMEKLQASFDEQKELAAHSTLAISVTVGTLSSSTNTTDLGGIMRKKHAAADSNSIMRTNAHSTTARNLCAIDWCKVNHKGMVGQFASYWDNLDAVAKKGYDDHSKLVKAAKATAIASLPTAAALVTFVMQPAM